MSKTIAPIFVLLLLSFLILSTSQSLSNLTQVKSIFSNGNFFFIIDNALDNYIYSLSESLTSLQTNISSIQSILYNKTIIKLTENSFVIFGLKSGDNFCFNIYSISSSASISQNKSYCNPWLRLKPKEKYSIKCNSNNFCILSTFLSNDTVIIKIGLEDNSLSTVVIPHNKIINIDNIELSLEKFDKNLIDCDYVNESNNNFFCILSGEKNLTNIVIIINGNFTNPDDLTFNIYL